MNAASPRITRLTGASRGIGWHALHRFHPPGGFSLAGAVFAPALQVA